MAQKVQKKGPQIDYTEFEKKAIENEDRETLLQLIEEYSSQNKIYKQQLYELTEQARQQAIDNKEVGQKISQKAEVTTKAHELLEEQLAETVASYKEKLQKLIYQQKDDLEQNQRQYELDVKQKDNEISDSTQKLQNYTDQMKKQQQLEDQIRSLKEEKIKQAHAHSDEISKMRKNNERLLEDIKRRNQKQKEETLQNAPKIAQKEVQKQAEELDSLNKNLKSQLEVSKKVLASEKTKQSMNIQEKKLFGRQVQLNEDFASEYQEVNIRNLKKIKALKELVEQKKDYISKEVSKYAKEIEYAKYENETKKKELEEQISAMNEYFQQKSQEYKQIKNLSRVILDQKSWVEGFFVESLDKVRQELRKSQQEKSKQKLPNINNNNNNTQQQDNSSVKSKLDKDKVDISELEPEEKEKIMRILYYKITQGAQPLPWFDQEEQNQMEQNSLIQREQQEQEQQSYQEQEQQQASMQQQLIESQEQSKNDSLH